jgi:flagellar motility protein MotE (MotC chaperone)
MQVIDLLMFIYIKTQKKGNQAETKPFTNFSIFHDNLITRLKSLSQIQTDFEKRCKDAEAKFSEKMNDMRKQLDNRWKQIDKFEASLKAYAETKAGWKKKLSQKEGEMEALKVRQPSSLVSFSFSFWKCLARFFFGWGM